MLTLVHHWPLANGSGTTSPNVVTAGMPLELKTQDSRTPQWTAGPNGLNALSFSGYGTSALGTPTDACDKFDYAIVLPDADLEPCDYGSTTPTASDPEVGLAFGCWIKCSSATPRIIMGRWTYNAYASCSNIDPAYAPSIFMLGMGVTGHVYLYIQYYNVITAYNVLIRSANTLHDGAWHHVFGAIKVRDYNLGDPGTYDYFNNYLWVDGALDVSYHFDPPPYSSLIYSASGWIFGGGNFNYYYGADTVTPYAWSTASNAASMGALDGMIADPRVYCGVPSTDDVKKIIVTSNSCPMVFGGGLTIA